MTERCIQQKTGSCGACPVLELVVKRVNETGQPVAAAAASIEKRYCPPGTRVQAKLIKPINPVSVGQSASSLVKVRLY